MSKKVNGFCTACGKNTQFSFDGDDWLCLNCGSLNTQGTYHDPESEFLDEDPDLDED